MTQARESKTVRLKFTQLKEHFPILFGHINVDDIFFLRVSRSNDGSALELIPNTKEPWCYVFPYKYCLMIYDEFEQIGIDEQMMMLAHKMFALPKNYQTFTIIKSPDIVLYKGEEQIAKWLVDHQFRSV